METDWERPVVMWEIQAVDSENMHHFYQGLFNWKFGDGRKVKSISPGIGAPEPTIAGSMRAGDTSRISLYIQVRDLSASLLKAVELGGAVVREPFDVPPNGTTLAWITDPEGNQLTLVQQ